MVVVAKVTGVREIVRNLDKADRRLAAGFAKGLKKAGRFLQRKSQQIVPVEFGNLKNSADTRWQGSGFDITVWVVYTAVYAIYVHERVELSHAPGKQAKFLEEPARQYRDEILALIAKEVAL